MKEMYISKSVCFDNKNLKQNNYHAILLSFQALINI